MTWSTVTVQTTGSVVVEVARLPSAGFTEVRRLPLRSNEDRFMSIAMPRSRKRAKSPALELPDDVITIPATAHTLAGFREWVHSDQFPEKAPVTFLEGKVRIDMSQEELQSHNEVKMEIARILMTLVREKGAGKYYGDGVLLVHPDCVMATNPDGMYISWESLDQGKVVLTPRKGATGQFIEVVGTPDWVLEVVSKSSVKKDNETLRKDYHRAGVAEYWIVDARGESIQFQILNRHERVYKAARSRDGFQYSSVFSHWFCLRRDEVRPGIWQYTLDMQAD